MGRSISRLTYDLSILQIRKRTTCTCYGKRTIRPELLPVDDISRGSDYLMVKRMPVPDQLRARIAAERAMIHSLLAGNSTAQIPGQEACIREFTWRLRHLQSEGLFYPHAYPAEVSWVDVTFA